MKELGTYTAIHYEVPICRIEQARLLNRVLPYNANKSSPDMMLRTNWYTPVHPQISAVQDTGASLGSPGAVEWTYVSELTCSGWGRDIQRWFIYPGIKCMYLNILAHNEH